MIKLSLPVKRLTTNEISLDLLFLLAFPFVLLLVNDSWSFLTPSLWVDPYIYEGFFWDLKKNLLLHKAALEFPYYSSRLPWLLMGNAAHSIASPDTANLILRLSLLYVSVLSLYAVVRMAWRNGLAALIAALPPGPGIVGRDMNTILGPHDPAWRTLLARYPDTPARPGPTFRERLVLDHLFFDLPDGWRATRTVLTDRYWSDHRPVLGVIRRER